MQKTQPLHCWKGVFKALLHSNESYSIVACVFVAAGNVFTELSSVGCRHIYMQRQPLVELFDNIYYNRTVYTDVLE
jgi:hypothetical protein